MKYFLKDFSTLEIEQLPPGKLLDSLISQALPEIAKYWIIYREKTPVLDVNSYMYKSLQECQGFVKDNEFPTSFHTFSNSFALSEMIIDAMIAKDFSFSMHSINILFPKPEQVHKCKWRCEFEWLMDFEPLVCNGVGCVSGPKGIPWHWPVESINKAEAITKSALRALKDRGMC